MNVLQKYLFSFQPSKTMQSDIYKQEKLKNWKKYQNIEAKYIDSYRECHSLEFKIIYRKRCHNNTIH